MLLFLLLGYLYSKYINVTFPCVSPEKHADPVEGATLEQVIIVTRHGARTPIDHYNTEDQGYWHCDGEDVISPQMYVAGNKQFRRYHKKLDPRLTPYNDTCDKGLLLDEGMKQHNNLGKFFREYLVDELKFLPKDLDPSIMYFRSSQVERCIRSAISFITGLYPPASPNEVLKLETGTSALEMMHPSTSQCKQLQEAWNDWVSSDEYKARKEEATPYLKPFVDALNKPWDEATWMFVGDWAATVACTNHSFPSNFNETHLKIAIEAVEYYSHGFFSFRRGIASSVMFREIMRIIEGKLSGRTKTKFAFLSAHDVSLIAILTTLGYKNYHWSPFRSHIVVETWRDASKKPFIRFVYNGDPVAVDFLDNQTYYSYSDFKSGIQPYANFCPELP